MEKVSTRKINRILSFLTGMFIFSIFFGLSPANGQSGSISGTVYESDGVTPISGIYVGAGRENCWSEDGRDVTDENGAYAISGLPAGDYYLRTYILWSSRNQITHIGEYYNNAATCDEADLVPLSAGENITDMNFQLDKSATISGKVTDSSGTGIADILVSAYPESEFTCIGFSGYSQCRASTDVNGAYTIFGMPAGDYYLRTYNFSQNYIREWYNNEAACYDADAVSVTAAENITNIDFQLDKGGTISGTITNNSGRGTFQTRVSAYWGSDACNGEYLNDTKTDENGAYTIVGLPSEAYIFQDGFDLDITVYIRSWYNNVLSCEEAVPVMVTVGSDTGSIDFQVIDITDYDVDWMPDQWEIHYFGDTSRDGSGDYDGDGFSDLDEYMAGTAPIKIEDEQPNTDNGTIDDVDDIINLDDGDDGGVCFIATAAHGSILEPQVVILREFGDRFLLNNSIGKVLIKLFNTYLPPIADIIADHESLRITAR